MRSKQYQPGIEEIRRPSTRGWVADAGQYLVHCLDQFRLRQIGIKISFLQMQKNLAKIFALPVQTHDGGSQARARAGALAIYS